MREFKNRIQDYSIETFRKGEWVSIAKGTKVGENKIIKFSEVQTKHLRVVFSGGAEAPSLLFLGAGKASLAASD